MTRTTNLFDAVRYHDIVKDLNPLFLEKLAGMAVEVNFRPDQIVFEEGDCAGNLYLMVSGTVALEMTSASRPVRVQTLHEGDAMGWSSVLLTHSRKRFQARTTTHVRVLAFDGIRLRQAFEEDPAFGYAMMQRLLTTVTERLDATRVQLADLYGRPAAMSF